MALATCTKDGAVSLNPMSFTDQHSNGILERLRYQRASGRFCDALIVVKDRKFNAHRMILAACSPYFDAILRYNKITKEKIVVNSDNPNIFEVLLNYIYSGTVVIDRNIVTELLKLANNLLIVRLKNYCAEYLERYIDVANCLSVRELAHKYNLSELLRRSAEFFDSNVNGCLLENVDLLEYGIHQLRELLNDSKYRDTIRPDVHLNLIVRWVGHKLAERESSFKDLLKECAFQQVTTMRLERMLDYNPFFALSESSLYVILQEMHNVGMSMEKYEVQYRNLVKKYCQDNVPPQPPPPNYYTAEASGNGATVVRLRGDLAAGPSCRKSINEIDEANDAEIRDFNRNATSSVREGDFDGSGGNFMAGDDFHHGGHSTAMAAADDAAGSFHHQQVIMSSSNSVPLHSQAPPTVAQNYSPAQPRPALKLRISLAGLASQSGANAGVGGQLDSALNAQASSKKRLLFGLNHYRKKQKLMLRRRGRPPKIRQSRFNDPANEDANGGNDIVEEPESCFYEFGDEKAENVHVINVFDEPDELDPGTIVDYSKQATAMETNVVANEGQHQSVEIQCEYCVFKGTTENQLRNHFGAVHSKNILYVCNICQFECKWNRQFYDHMRQHFPGPAFQCDNCPYTADRIHVLLSHRLTHTSEKPFKCPDCEFRCRNRSNLVTHFRLHSGERPFQCPECKKRFAIRATFDQHVAAHSDERPFVCDECDFATKYQSHLISHRRIHSGDLFHCEVEGCDYSSPKKSQLAAHLRTHLAVRSHQCRICSRSFIEKSHLIRHERIHLADKPFKCGSCDYASSRRDKLKEHILKHHNNASTSSSGGAGGSSGGGGAPGTSSDAMHLYRRRYRRARQIAQLTAQAKQNPPDASNFFRPIPPSEAMQDKQEQSQPQFQIPRPHTQQHQQSSHQLIQQQQQQFLSQRRQRSGSESAIMAAEIANNNNNNDSLLQTGSAAVQQQQPTQISSVSAMAMMDNLLQQQEQQRHQQQSVVSSGFSSLHSQQLQSQQQLGRDEIGVLNNNERFQQHLDQQQQNQMIGNRPCSASLPQKDSYGNSSSLSPSCYSLHNFQHHNAQHHSGGTHHLGHHSSVDGAFNETAAATPDTDLSTPGPHLDNLRNPNSVSNLFDTAGRVGTGGSGPGTVVGHHHHSHPFGSHQLSVDESQLQAAVVAAAAAAAVATGDGQMTQQQDDPIQRPMSLPNYGGLMQQFQLQQLQQQQEAEGQMPAASANNQRPAPYYNLMGLNAGQMIMQTQQHDAAQRQQQQQNNHMQQPWS